METLPHETLDRHSGQAPAWLVPAGRKDAAYLAFFAGKSLAIHLLRGVVGAGALAYALLGHESSALLWTASLGLSILAFRGCPTCWLSGLFEHISARLERREPGGCANGVCTPRIEAPPLERPE